MSFIELIDDLVTREVGGETVIVPIRANVADLDAVYTLNEVGSFIWNYLNKNKKAKSDKVVAAIVETFCVDKDTATKDFEEFMDALNEAGLIKIHIKCDH